MNNWSRRKVPPSRYADIAKVLNWSVEELLLDGPDGPADRTGRDGGPWRLGETLDEGSPLTAAALTIGQVANAIGGALAGLSESRRKTISMLVAAQIADMPDDREAAAIDALAPGLTVSIPVPSQERLNIDRHFREAFYDVLDSFKTPDGRKVINDLRDAIEHKVADALRLDINQARRALNARQSEQG
ncbi:hypothetical protein PEC18_18660 [Paucibacter sp. O1-1]|nr:hypothetical protein [Paucibacter sp. O1-1]MDA3827820.1 hypothetical protein [Paucibacter sp. O1-1]